MENTSGGPSEVTVPQSQDSDAKQEQKQKKKKDKVRSAWISFIGRILAQILGAVATITLGLAVADRLRADLTKTADAAPATRIQRDSGLSVAVLPMELFSPDPGQQYLADGLTEELITNLMTESELRVVSRTSSMQYRQHPQSVPEIANTLGVSMVVEGCLIRDGDQIRITARVIDANRDTSLGSVDQTHRMRRLLTQQAEIAQSIARELAAIMLRASHPE